MQKWLNSVLPWRRLSMHHHIVHMIQSCKTEKDCISMLQFLDTQVTFTPEIWEHIFVTGRLQKTFSIVNVVDQYFATCFPGETHCFERLQECKASIIGFYKANHFSDMILQYWESSTVPTNGPWWPALFMYIPMERWRSLDIYDKTLRLPKQRSETTYNSLWFKMYSGLIRAKYGNYCAEASKQWNEWIFYWKPTTLVNSWTIDYPRDATSFNTHRIGTFFHTQSFISSLHNSKLELLCSTQQAPFNAVLATLFFGRALSLYTQSDACIHFLDFQEVKDDWNLAANLYANWCCNLQPSKKYQGLVEQAAILKPNVFLPYQYGRLYQILTQFESGQAHGHDFEHTRPSVDAPEV